MATTPGHLTEVISAPENDVYVVSGTYGEVLIPAIDDVIRDVDLTAGVILIEIIPGLLP
jgi:16S rRNA processing protein RimM